MLVGVVELLPQPLQPFDDEATASMAKNPIFTNDIAY